MLIFQLAMLDDAKERLRKWDRIIQKDVRTQADRVVRHERFRAEVQRRLRAKGKDGDAKDSLRF